MKLMQPGFEADKWFIGRTSMCNICAVVVLFDASDADKATVDTSYWNEGDRELPWDCPRCGTGNILIGPSGAMVDANESGYWRDSRQ